MKILYRILLILILIILQSCAKDKEETNKIKEVNQELEMISTYGEAIDYINKGDSFYAAKKFLEAELLFPQSDWAPKSALMASYSYYSENYYDEAIFNLERFIKTYPKDKRLPYAHFLLAMCYYEEILDEKKDLAPLLIGKEKFQFVIKNYPNTDFALDSKYKIDLINDILASKEMYIGKHYVKKEKWIPAINRFKNVLNNYETTIYAEEAIHRLVEIHYRIGLLGESKKYASLLGYNYLSSEWYKKSYKIFNKNYTVVNIKRDKKEKEKVLKKFRKLFE
jgi:outer membrane protein assembly factor BamD